MRFKTLMVIKAVACLVFAPLLLFLPRDLLALVGTDFGSGAALTARMYGASLIGNLMLAWFARGADESTVRQAIVLDLFAYDTAGFLAALAIQISGGLNPLGWAISALYLFFAVGFGWFLLPQKKAA